MGKRDPAAGPAGLDNELADALVPFAAPTLPEADAVLGAQKIIEENAPVLAICLYHAQEHLWQIPLLIHSFGVKYDFFLRRYADECWEIVCYAIPKDRLIN